MKAVTVTFLVVLVSLSSAQFADVPDGHWAEEAVWSMTNAGVITGYPDGLFHGNDTLTRYQAAIMLERVMMTYGIEDLDKLWEQLGAAQRMLNQAESDQRAAEARLQGQEDALLRLQELTSLSANQDSVTRLEQQVERVRRDTERVRQETEAALQAFQTQANEVSDEALKKLEQDLTALRQQQAEMRRVAEEQAKLTQAHAERLEAIDGELLGLNERLEAVEVRNESVSGDLSVSVGAQGCAANLAIGVDVTTPYGSVKGDLGTQERSLAVNANLGDVGLKGLYEGGENGDAVLAGPSLNLSPALRANVVGGVDAGGDFSVGGYTEHLPFERDSVIQGLGLEVGALFGGETVQLSSVYGAASFTVSDDTFFVTPEMLYRRDEGVYQAFIPSLSAGYSFGSVALVATGRLGLISDLEGGEGSTIPEVELGLQFTGGGFAAVTLNGGLPGVGLLSTATPMETDSLDVGFSVGYTFNLEALR